MSKNNILIPPITQKTTLENAKKWLSIIRFGESGSVIQLQDDCEYRVLEVIQNSNILKTFLGPYYKKYILAYMPIDQRDLMQVVRETIIEVAVDRKISPLKKLFRLKTPEILALIAKKGYEVGLFISHIVPLLKKNNFQSLIDFELLVRTNKNFSAIVFSEIDISHEKYRELADKCSFLFDHIIKYPMYGEQDVRQFIKHYSRQWDTTFSEKSITEIIKACGGYLWLIHQAIRLTRDNPQQNIEQVLAHELLLNKVEIIWEKFSNEEKNIIRKESSGHIQESDTLTHEYNYLKQIKVIFETNSQVQLSISLFTEVIKQENRLNNFQISENRVFLGEKEITLALSKKERVLLLLLLSAKKKIVSRDKIAQAIWGKDWEEKYSDWAIDRLAHRIRKKIKTLGVDEKLLKTVKKKGFIFG